MTPSSAEGRSCPEKDFALREASRRVTALGDPTLCRWVRLLRALQLMLAAVLAVLWARLLAHGGL